MNNEKGMLQENYDESRLNISTIVDNLEIKQLTASADPSSKEFKRRIDNLNLKFYAETDKYIQIKQELEKSQDSLFLLLFRQIAAYTEEIERLYSNRSPQEVSR